MIIDHSQCIVRRGMPRLATSVEQLLWEVEGALTAAVAHGERTFLVINTDRPDQAFVQAFIANGAIQAEAAAGLLRPGCCPGWHRLEDHQRIRLITSNWQPPDSVRPAWSRVLPAEPRFLPVAALLLVRTLADIYQVTPAECSFRFGTLAADAPRLTHHTSHAASPA